MKNQIFKRLLTWVLLFCIIITNVPTVAFAADEGTPPTQGEISDPNYTAASLTSPDVSQKQQENNDGGAPGSAQQHNTEQQENNNGGAPGSAQQQNTEQQENNDGGAPGSAQQQNTEQQENNDGGAPGPAQQQNPEQQENNNGGELGSVQPPIPEQQENNNGVVLGSVKPQNPEQQELVDPIADGTETVRITVTLADGQSSGSPVLDLSNFCFYDKDGTSIEFSGPIESNGSNGAVYTYLIRGIHHQNNQDMWVEPVNADAGMYEFSVIGDTDSDGKLLMTKGDDGYYSLAEGCSIILHVVEPLPEPVAPTVIFKVEWQDKLNAAGLRPKIEDIIAVYLSEGEGLEDSEPLDPTDLSIEEVLNENGEETGLTTYKITFPVIEGMSEVPASYIKIIFLEDRMPAYTNIQSDAKIDGRHSVSLEDREDPTDGSKIAVADEPVVIGLEQYEVVVTPIGLSEEAMAKFAISATRGGEKYTSYLESAEGVYDGFTKFDAEGKPAAYTISWPDEIDDYKLVSAESAIVDAGNLNASPKYAKKFVNPGDHVTKSRDVLWFDTDANYSHSGQLKVEISVTVNGTPITVAPVWDSEKGHYVHQWTADDMDRLGIELNPKDMDYFLAEMDDLIIEDTGDNNLNRTLTASTTKYITVPEGDDYVFQLGEIEVTGVSYIPESDSAVIQDYAIGTDPTNKKTLTLYPMTYVDFHFDVRAGDKTAPSVLAELRKQNAIQLLLKDSVTPGWQAKPIYYEYFKNNFEIEDVKLTPVSIDGDHASYRILLPLYDVEKRQISYAFEAVDAKDNKIPLDPLDEDIWLKVEYDNTAVPGMGTKIDKTYEDGTMVFILAGVTDYTATKIWADDGSPETIANRPQATYTLWRYSEKSGDYTTAAMQMIPQENGSPVKEAAISNKVKRDTTIEIPKSLDRFDSDGYPYVYFIRESLSGGTNYEKIYGVVSEGPNGEESIKDTLPYQGGREGSDRSIYNGGTITNRRSEPTTAKVTKKWNAAYYQDRLDELSVKMTLYAKHKDRQGEHDDAFVVTTVIIDDFDEFNSSRSAAVEINRFDDHGHELEFWWEETAVFQNGVSFDVGANADNNNVPYTLPLNKDTMEADSYSETSEEYFVANVQQDANGNATVTNSLKGDTEYWLLKEWRDMPAGDATFQLVKIDENGVMTEVAGEEGEYTIPKTADGYDTPDENGNFSSGWIKAWVNLEKYDANGNRYGYIAKEKESDDYQTLESYGHDVDDDSKEEANSFKVINSPVGTARDIDLRKVWLDDTANTARDSVYFNVYTKDGKIVYGTDETGVGLLGPEPIEITATNEWTKPGVDVTLWKVNGDLLPELDIPPDVVKEGADAVIKFKSDHLYKGDFYVREVRVGENKVRTDKLTDSGYPTVTSKGTDFVVIYNTYNTTNKDDYTKGTNRADEEGFYTVTNLRVGVTDLTVTKQWYDDAQVKREEYYTAKFIVSCDEDEERVVEVESEGLGYAKVHKAVMPDGLQKITNAKGEHVSSAQEVDTTKDKSEITFYNLPLYDEYGRILHYSVEEDLKGEDPYHKGRYEISSSTMKRDPAEDNNSKVIASQTFTNTFKNTTDVTFDLLWLDDYRVSNGQRPDVFLYLYRTKYTYDENGTIIGEEIVRNDFVEYLWEGTNNHKKTEDWWSYTFSGLDEYDEYGNKIYYYATIHTHANREILDYIAPQYAEGQSVSNYEAYLENPHSSVSKIDGKYVVNHDPVSDIIGKYLGTDTKTNDVLKQENTFVIQLKNDINVVGHKVWEKIPDGFPIEDLPLLSFKLYRNRTVYEKEKGIKPTDKNGICTAAVVRYKSPSQEYNFEMKWYGINDHNGNLVDKNTYIWDVDGEKWATALEIWCSMTRLDASLYGKPLPKYDGRGEMYQYSIIEIVADSKDSIDIAYEDLQNAVNGYNIINTFNTTITNQRPISVSKNWSYNEGFEYTYPSAVTYKLYRFYKIDYRSGYSAPELMGTRTLTRKEAEKGENKVFEEQLVYAPNGNKYIYYISEDLINGYNTEGTGIPLMTIDGEVTSASCESGVINWPTVIGGKDEKAWYSPAFVLNENAKSSNKNEPGKVDVTNNYTGMPQTEYEGVKTWEDYSNNFGTRPDSITLTLYRNTNTISKKQVVATIVLDKDRNAQVTPVGNVNVTSAIFGNHIKATNTVSVDDWSFKIEFLDGYAPTGEEWIYSVEETLPEDYKHYKKSVVGNKITNSFYTSYTGTKSWVGLYDEIAYPNVGVKLQVSTDGVNWKDAESEFGAKLGDYPYTDTLNGENGWQTTFSNLPIGTGRGDVYKPYRYRLLETDIDGSEVVYDGTDNSEKPSGITADGQYSVNASETAIENHALKTKLSVTKTWTYDSNNAFGTRYSENGEWRVSYHIKRDYTSDGATVTETLMVPDGSTDYVLTIKGTDDQISATAEIKDLPAYTPSGKEYTYYAVELDVNGEEIENGKRYNGAYETTYNHSHSENGDSTVATNRLIFVELEVTKMWMDDGNDSIRPEKLELTLEQNGKPIEYPGEVKWKENADDKNVWFIAYTKLPKYDADGKPYTYTVSEAKQGGYRVPVVDDVTPINPENQTKEVKNIQIKNIRTCFSIEKLGIEKLGENGKPLNDVTLVFESTAAIDNPKLGGSHYYQLTWRRNINGVASYEIKYSSSDKDFSKAVLWASGDGSMIYGLPEGTYKLTDETTIPHGYYASSLGGGFTLSSESGVQHLKVSGALEGADENGDIKAYLKVPNLPTRFSITKQDKNTNGNIDLGWEFTIQPVGESRFVAKSADENVTSARKFAAGDKEWSGVLIVDNVYKLNETVAPPGYKLNSETVYFKLDKKNTVIICNEEGTAIDSSYPAEGDKNGVLIFEDEPFEFEVRKYTSTQKDTLITAHETTFRLYDITDSQNEVAVKLDGKDNDNIVTSNGTLTLSSTATEPKLTVGHTYRLVEEIAPAGYILPDPKPSIEFTFGNNGSIIRESNKVGAVSRDGDTISYTDDPISLVLTKKDSGDRFQEETILPNVSFALYDITKDENNPDYVIATTDSNGEITFGAEDESMLLVIGGHSYKLVEQKPSGYTAVGTIYFSVTKDGKIDIAAADNSLPEGVKKDGDYNLVAVNTRNRGTLSIVKKDGDTDEALNNIKFELYRAKSLHEDGTPLTWFERLLGLITGNGYVLTKEFSWDGSGSDGIGNYGAEKGRIVVENLDWGRYKLKETAAEGYILDETEYFFTVGANSTDNVITIDDNHLINEGVINNTPIRVQVNKVAEGNLDVNLAGAVYELYHVKEDGTVTMIPATSTDNALATWVWNSELGTGEASRLTAGTYKLVETVPPPGYTKAEDITFTVNEYGVVKPNGVTIGANNTIPLIKAVDTDFEISIEKLSDNGNKLAGAKFEIYDITNGGEERVVLASDAEIRSLDSGALVIGSTETVPALKVGHRYKVEETIAPNGYILPDDHPAVHFTITEDGGFSDVSTGGGASVNGNAISFTDKPISLKLVKYDDGDHVAIRDELGGVKFELYDVTDKRRVGEAVTEDETGLITFGAEGESMLPVIGDHEYILKEIPQAGYEPLDDLHFKVKTNGEIEIIEETDGYTLTGTTKLEAVNKRKLGTLTLFKKEDSVSNEALNNVKFELYRARILDEDGTPLTWFERLLGLITGNGYVLTKEFSWDGSGSDGIGNYGAEKGQIVVENLDWGVYKLVETVADGYILPEEEERTYSFVINDKNLDAVVKFRGEKLEANTVFNKPNRVIVQKVDAENNTIILPGAEYELYYVEDKAGNEIERKIPNDTDAIATWAWNSDKGTGEATHLSPGTYKLVETKSPYGYIIEDPVFFEIDAHGVVTVDDEVVDIIENTPVVKAADTKTRFSFTKHELYNERCADGSRLDPNATRILDGVTFTAYEDKELTKEIKRAVSKDGVVEFIELPLGTNYIKETATVPGHVLDDTLYMVVITSEGNDKLLKQNGSKVDKNTVVNDVYRGSFSFTKVNELDNNTIIPGAVYGLYKTVKIGFESVSIPYEALVTKATADETGRVEFEGLLMDVEYTVKELSVPAGCYVSDNPIVFKLTWTESGVVTTIIDDGEGTIAEDSNGYIWREPQTVIEFLKTNHKGVPLPGAVLQLRDKDGNVVMVPDFNGEMVESWVSTKTALVVTGILAEGETYWLYELDAPDGYNISKPIKFTVPDEPIAPDQDFVVTITMKNYPYPVTGDDSNLFGYIGAMAASGLGLIFLAIFSRHRKRKSV